jgi:hypothetical protein
MLYTSTTDEYESEESFQPPPPNATISPIDDDASS